MDCGIDRAAAAHSARGAVDIGSDAVFPYSCIYRADGTVTWAHYIAVGDACPPASTVSGADLVGFSLESGFGNDYLAAARDYCCVGLASPSRHDVFWASPHSYRRYVYKIHLTIFGPDVSYCYCFSSA